MKTPTFDDTSTTKCPPLSWIWYVQDRPGLPPSMLLPGGAYDPAALVSALHVIRGRGVPQAVRTWHVRSIGLFRIVSCKARPYIHLCCEVSKFGKSEITAATPVPSTVFSLTFLFTVYDQT